MTSLLHWLQRRMLWLLSATYVLGAWAPSLGRSMRDVKLSSLRVGAGSLPITLPMLMLGFLLVVACLGSKPDELRHTVRRPGLLLFGLCANATYPLIFAAVMALALSGWHNPHEAQNILVGLALIGAMPIAGASTAWSQNADGNIALSLSLVLASTLLSPVVTPWGLHAVGTITSGDYSEDLHELAREGSSSFLVLAVVGPSVVGLLARVTLGAERCARILPTLKALNLIDLLLLNYANASMALPQVVRAPDWDFLLIIFTITTTMCVGAFGLGWWLPRLFGADKPARTALMFGMGMNNNGTGLVLAAHALADHPLVTLPIIFYNLVQQVVAGIVDRERRRATKPA